MKKLIGLIGVVGCAVAAVSTPALANDDLKFYVGGDYQYLSLSTKTAAKAAPNLGVGFDAHAGVRYDWFAAELGYMRSHGQKHFKVGPPPPPPQISLSDSSTVSGPTLDLFGYLPIAVNHGNGLYGLATIGVSDLSGKASLGALAGPTKFSDREIGFRAGAGFEWRVADRVGVRAIGRYQSADFGGLAKSGVIVTAGVNVYF